METTTLPPFDAVRPRPLADVLADARRIAGPPLLDGALAFDPPEPPETSVIDVAERVPRAVALVLAACAGAAAGRGATVIANLAVYPTRVRVSALGDPARDAVDEGRALLEPLGGAVTIDGGEVELWLPKA